MTKTAAQKAKARRAKPRARSKSPNNVKFLMEPNKSKERLSYGTNNAVTKAYLSGPNVSPMIRSELRVLLSRHDRWLAMIVGHLGDRSSQYPLPSVFMSGFGSSNNVAADYPGTASPFSAVLPSLEPMGTYDIALNQPYATANQRILFGGGGLYRPDSLEVSRYNVFCGRLETVVDFILNPGSTEVWLLADPTSLHPLTVIDMSNPASPAGVGNVLGGFSTQGIYPWTNDPMALPTFYADGSISADKSKGGNRSECQSFTSDTASCSSRTKIPVKAKLPNAFPVNPAVTLLDRFNYIYPGNMSMSVDAINLTAFSSTSMRAKDYGNIIHRFVDYDDTAGFDTDIGFQVNFTPAKSAYASYSGSMWTVSHTYTDPPGAESNTQCLRQLGINLLGGYPMVQVIMTNSNPGALNVSLNVYIESWQGIAPVERRFAGTQPFETMPWSIPDFMRIGRAFGSVGDDTRQLYDNVSNSFATTAVSRMNSQSPITRALGSTIPAHMVPTVVASGRLPPFMSPTARKAAIAASKDPEGFVATVEKSGSRILKGAMDFLGNIGSTVGNSVASTLSSKALTKFGKWLGDEAPFAAEELMTVAPILAAAGRRRRAG